MASLLGGLGDRFPQENNNFLLKAPPLAAGSFYGTAVLLFIRLLACVDRGGAIAQHALDQPGQLMRCRRHRLRGAQPRSHPTVRGPQSAVTLDEALGRQP